MTEEYDTLAKRLNSSLFRYAHITGALEFYMLTLENPNLQRAVSKVLSGAEVEWKQIHRFMVIDGETITWYPELPVQAVIQEKNSLLGFLYGLTLSHIIGDLDFYLSSILQNCFGNGGTSGSSWETFIRVTKIDLLSSKHGQFVYILLQERHKLEHNQAQIDRIFLERTSRQKVSHAYKEGDAIQKSHIDVLRAHEIIREFAEEVDEQVARLIGRQNP